MDKYDFLRRNGEKRKGEAEKKFEADLKRIMMLIMSFRGRRDLRGFVRISSKLLKKKFHNYHKLIRHLEEEGKVSVLRQYIIGEKAFGYRVNLDLEEKARIIKWYNKYNKPESEGEYFGYLNKVKRPDLVVALKVIEENCTIDAVAAKSEKVYVEDGEVMINGRRFNKKYYVVTYMDSGKKYYYGKDKMRKVIGGIDVWYYKDKFYADNNFFEKKSQEIRSNWTQKVLSFEQGHFKYSTSLRNGRSFDNLTLMPKKLIKLYKHEEGEFFNIDGVSYQATLAKHLPILINNIPILSTYLSFLTLLPPIVRGAFEKALDSGLFYEEIIKQLALRGIKVSRDKAKTIFFTAIFSKNFDNEWGKLLEVFDPEMKKQIDDFKRMFGYNHYAIALQLAESGIWSRIKLKLEEMGIYYIGKHDAVLIPRSRWEEALKVIIDIHNEYLEGFHISVEGPGVNRVYNQDYQITKAA